MFERELLNKIREEKTLTGVEEARLEDALSGPSLSSEVVSKLSDDAPSMTWRSRLNEKVSVLAGQAKRRSRWISAWRPVLGLGFACAMALFFTLNRPMTSHPDAPFTQPGLEAGLIDAHERSVEATEIAGPGLAAHEAVPVASKTDEDIYDWSEADVETL